MIRMLELFGGYGSQALALENLGIEFTSDLCDIDKYAEKAYNQIHGETLNYGDICKIDETKLPHYDLITYSSPCFTSDTLVLTDSGYKEIYDIEVGFDKVLTHTNTYKTVKDIFMNGVKDIVSIRCMGVDEIKCTPNHKFFARKRSKKYSKRKLFYVFSEPEWIEAKDLTKDTYLGISINSESEIPKWDGIDIGWSDGRKTRHKNELSNLMGNNDFWWVVGRYMGDGWLNKNGGIKICCAKDELEEIRKHLNRLPFKYCVVEERTVYKVQLPKKEIGLFFEQFGRGANNKHLTKSVFNLPEDLLKCFLDGYFSADGCFYKKQGMIACCSVSRELIYGIAQCCAKVYKRPYRIYKNKRPSKTTIEGRIVNQMDDYTFRMKLVKNKKEQAFYENGFIWTPFKERKSAGKEYVYDLEVEEDHSFTAQNVIVHNCQDFSQAGKQAGGEKGSGTRSSLLWECERIIRAVKPKYLLMENVKALTSKKFMPLFANWLRTLEDMGYKNWWKVLNAKDYGVPQNRERVFVVSILGVGNYQFPNPIPLTKRLKDVLEPVVDEKYYINKCFGNPINTEPDGTSRTIKAQYYKNSTANFLRKDSFGATGVEEPLCCASRGRNPDNPSDRKTGSPTEQRLEVNQNGTTNTITTVQKDNYVIEPVPLDEQNGYIRKDGCVGTLTTDGSSPKHNNRVLEPRVIQEPINLYPNSGNPQAGRVYNTQGISPAMDTCQGGNRMPKIIDDTYANRPAREYTDTSPSIRAERAGFKVVDYRIRKLTPRECWRLMGVRDEQFDKLHDISNSQLYKLAGNSIVVDVLMAIFKNLFMPTEQKGQLELL